MCRPRRRAVLNSIIGALAEGLTASWLCQLETTPQRRPNAIAVKRRGIDRQPGSPGNAHLAAIPKSISATGGPSSTTGATTS